MLQMKSLLSQTICLLLFCLITQSQIVSTVDFLSNFTQTNSIVYSNMIGLSMNFNELISQFNNSLFEGYISNSYVYNNWQCNFDQAIHMPIGYKYNCSLFNNLTNGSSTCTLDLSTNSTLLTQISNYLLNNTNDYGASLGWDMQAANFTDINYLRNFVNFVLSIYNNSKQPFNIELVDRGDQFAALGLNANYSATEMIKDCISINNAIRGIIMSGPGITDSADDSWYDYIQDIHYYCGYFTVRAVVFQNVSTLSIPHLLSQNYTSKYLINRFTRGGNYVFVRGGVGINDIRMVADDAGVDGITNSFAAGLWAIEMAMQFAILGGVRIDFFNPVANASYQSVTGHGPLYQPSALYYALLFTIIANQNSPLIQLPVIKAGSSSSIKAYGLSQGTSYGFILLNKDMNQSLTGKVKVYLTDPNGIACMYLKADYLNSTSNISLAGISFISNISFFQGNYTRITYQVQLDSSYLVDIKYAQALYCQTLSAFTTTQFPTDPTPNNQLYTRFTTFLSLVTVLLLY